MKNIKFFYIIASNKNEAEKIATKLLDKKLIACANVISNVNSYFVWKNKIQNSKEIIICGKTISKNQKEIVHAVKSLHSYSVPCVIFFDIKNGNKDFLKWIKQSVI
jgi:periplasmic divalent cation tolerance protein